MACNMTTTKIRRLIVHPQAMIVHDCATQHHMPQCQTQGPRAREKVGSTAEVSKFRTPAVQMSKQLPQSHHRVMYDRVRPSSILVVKASSKGQNI